MLEDLDHSKKEHSHTIHPRRKQFWDSKGKTWSVIGIVLFTLGVSGWIPTLTHNVHLLNVKFSHVTDIIYFLSLIVNTIAGYCILRSQLEAGNEKISIWPLIGNVLFPILFFPWLWETTLKSPQESWSAQKILLLYFIIIAGAALVVFFSLTTATSKEKNIDTTEKNNITQKSVKKEQQVQKSLQRKGRGNYVVQEEGCITSVAAYIGIEQDWRNRSQVTAAWQNVIKSLSNDYPSLSQEIGTRLESNAPAYNAIISCTLVQNSTLCAGVQGNENGMARIEIKCPDQPFGFIPDWRLTRILNRITK